MRHGAAVFAKRGTSLLAERYLGVKALTLHSRSNASLGLITRFIPRLRTECNRSRLASLKSTFALVLAGPVVAK